MQNLRIVIFGPEPPDYVQTMDALGFDATLYEAVPAWLRKLVFRHAESEAGTISPAFSPAFVDRFINYVEPFYKYYFRCEVRHLERIPETSPVFVVANHNAMGVVEIPLLAYAWHERFGHNRPVHGLAHRMVFRVPLVRDILPRMGAVPAAPDVALRTLKAGRDLLVFPGGDWEAGRPFSERGKIDFGGRKGFIRVALQTGVPVVPLVICGAHETALILSRGDRIAHALGLDVSYRLKTLPITPQALYLAWKVLQILRRKASPLLLPLWIANTWMAFPWLPSKVTMEVLDPIDLRKELQGIEDEEERLARGYEIVTGRMQEKLTELQAERRTFLG